MSGFEIIAMLLMVGGLIAVGVGVAALGSDSVKSTDVPKGITIAGTIAGIFGVVFTFYKLL